MTTPTPTSTTPSPLQQRCADLDALLADCKAQLDALDSEMAARKQPVLDQQAAYQAEHDAIQKALGV